VSFYRRIDRKINTRIKGKSNVFSLGENEKYQSNYLEYISRMAIYGIPQKIYDYHPKVRRESSGPQKRCKHQFV
jgi:hypothetical protein